MSQDIFTLVIGLVALILLATVAFVVVRGIRQEKDLGNQFVKGLMQQHGFALLIITLISVFGETLVISSFEPEGSDMDFIPRVIAHIVVAIFSWILLTQFPNKLLKAIELLPWSAIFSWPPFKKAKFKAHWDGLLASKLSLAQMILIFVTPSIYLFVGVLLPFMNLYLLALGLGADLQLELFMYDWFYPFKDMEPSDYYATIPIDHLKYTTIDTVGLERLPRDYNPFKDMPFELIMMMGTVFVAELGAMFKGLNYITESPFEYKLLDKGRKEVKKQEKEKKMDESEQKLNKICDEILIHFGLEGEKYDSRRADIVEYTVDHIVNKTDAVRQRFTNTLARMNTNKPKKGTEDYKTWVQDVRQLWQSKASNNSGFSRALPGVKNTD